jgi:hypothetical protein
VPTVKALAPGKEIAGMQERESAGAVRDTNVVPVRVVREIRDPHTGLTWLLRMDTKNRGGPGRMLPAEQDLVANPWPVVIRSGDRVVVEEHTPSVEASLEAVALGAAAIGCRLSVRLKIGGKVVRAVALAPGRAALMPSWEPRP